MWGTAVWSSLDNTVATYEGSIESMALVIRDGEITPQPLNPFSEQSFSKRESHWKLISCPTLWAIWENKCKKVFKGKQTPAVESVKEIWAELIYNLRGQYDNLT